MAKQTLPKWKPEDVLYCAECEIVFTKAKAKKEEEGLFGEAPGYYCPKCDTRIAEIVEGAK